jgi:ribonuclease HI
MGAHDIGSVYLAELGALCEAAELAERMLDQGQAIGEVTIYSDSTSALQSIAQPRHQSGQRLLQRIPGTIQRCWTKERQVRFAWIPSHSEVPGHGEANRLARTATAPLSIIDTPSWAADQFKSVVLRKHAEKTRGDAASCTWTTGRLA